eukprot:754284_1
MAPRQSIFRKHTLYLIIIMITIYGIAIISYPYYLLEQSAYLTRNSNTIDVSPPPFLNTSNTETLDSHLVSNDSINTWNPPFSTESDIHKLPPHSTELYHSEGQYFKSFIHYKDNWQSLAGTKWEVPNLAANISSYIPDRQLMRRFNYSIINYPIYPFFLTSTKIRTHDMITIVTQSSLDRLPLVSLVAQHWHEIISLAIYIPLEASLVQTQHIIYAFWHGIELNTSTVLDIHLLFETEYIDKPPIDRGRYRVMYPVNHLRNIALQCAQSEYVLLADADFIPSHNLHVLAKQEYTRLFQNIVNKSGNIAYRMEKYKIALIFPAFEFNLNDDRPWDYKLNSTDIIPLARSQMIEAYKENRTVGFHMRDDQCPKCHNVTDYRRWMLNDTVDPYTIEYVRHYEPYIMTRRVGLHRYDARWRGYGYNKVFHLEGLAGVTKKYGRKVYQWFVSPQCFLFHIPHEKSQSRNIYNDDKDKRGWLMALVTMANRDLHVKNKRNVAGTITA